MKGCPLVTKRRPSRKEDSLVVEPMCFIDLGSMDIEADGEADVRIKVADIRRFEDLAAISSQVYDGNIMLVDFASVVHNKEAVDVIMAELRNVAADCNGDVVVVGKEMVVVSPNGMRISRQRIQGSF